MSTENIRAFFNQAQTDETLQNLPSSEGIDALVKFSQTTAFPFTAEELVSFKPAKALSDADLAEVAGGGRERLDVSLKAVCESLRDFFGFDF